LKGPLMRTFLFVISDITYLKLVETPLSLS